MSSSLSVTKQITDDGLWEITAEVVSGSLPTDIFVYKNTGESVLGEYIGVCNLEEYQRFQLFTGEAIPTFGNRFVKSTQAKIRLGINDDPDAVMTVLVNSIKTLSTEFSNTTPTTKIILIP